MDEPLFEFEPPLFFKVLAATLGVVFLGWAGSYWLYGELTTVDIGGSLIAAPIFAYMVHLWILPQRN